MLQGTQQPVEQEVQELIQHLPVVGIQVHLEEVTQLQDLATHRQDKASRPTLFQATQHSLEAILPSLCILPHQVVILLELQEVILLLEDNQVILLPLVDLLCTLVIMHLLLQHRVLVLSNLSRTRYTCQYIQQYFQVRGYLWNQRSSTFDFAPLPFRIINSFSL